MSEFDTGFLNLTPNLDDGFFIENDYTIRRSCNAWVSENSARESLYHEHNTAPFYRRSQLVHPRFIPSILDASICIKFWKIEGKSNVGSTAELYIHDTFTVEILTRKPPM